MFDPETYFKELGALKEKYKEKLDIRIGVEFGLQPHLAKKAKTFTAANPYDFVIGSMHVVGGKDPYYPEFFEGISDVSDGLSHIFLLFYRESSVKTVYMQRLW